MPACLGMCSLGHQQDAANLLTIVGGTTTYSTADAPHAESPTTVTATGATTLEFRRPFYNHPGGTTFTPSDADGDIFFLYMYKSGANGANNNTLKLGVGNGGTELFSVSCVNTTGLVTIRVAGTVRATAAVAAISLNAWLLIHVRATGNKTGDTVSVYMNGDLSTAVVTYTLIAADQTNLAGLKANEFRASTKASTAASLDKFGWFAAFDPNDANFSGSGIQAYAGFVVKEKRFASTIGTPTATGTHTNIDEAPPSNSDTVSFGAVGQTIKMGLDSTSDPVFAMQVSLAIERGDTSAGVNMDIKIDDGVNNRTLTVPAPAAGGAVAVFDTDANSTAWNAAKYTNTDVHLTAAT